MGEGGLLAWSICPVSFELRRQMAWPCGIPHHKTSVRARNVLTIIRRDSYPQHVRQWMNADDHNDYQPTLQLNQDYWSSFTAYRYGLT